MASRKSAQRLEQLSSQFKHKPLRDPNSSLKTEIEHLLAEGKHDEAAQKALSAFLQPPRYKPRPEQLSILERAETSTFISDGNEITQYIWNHSAATSVIIAHGFGTSTAFLAPLISHLLSTTSHRLVAIDQPGHGESGGTGTSLRQYIANLGHLFDRERAEGKQIKALIGHSVGATAIFMLYYQCPTIFNDLVGKPSIVALNPPLQSKTLMQGFCAQHGLPVSLVDGMRAAFRPSPEDVLRLKIGEKECFQNVRILLVQDLDDKVALSKGTEELASQLETGGASVRLEWTRGLGHFGVVGNTDVVRLIGEGCE